MSPFKTIVHEADLCIVGGGISGLCAAVSAARHGARVILMQERPMLGGNASSEIRMWVCGAHGKNNRESGLIEEMMLENYYRNPSKNYSVWDGILYGLARYQPGIELLLNCTCNACEMDGNRIVSVTGWQLTTQSFHTVRAAIFADCSGDSVLAPLTGADFRIGREARAEFGEDIGPEEADLKTMGMSCIMQAREETFPSEFIPPEWAYHYTREDLLPHRVPRLEYISENFWYLELGGNQDSIADTETLRDELLKTAYGVWDFVKNAPENKEKYVNWRLDWMGILPGKRESRRYLGDHIMTQNDICAEGRFDDLVAYGGWPMDDHDPMGFLTKGYPNVNYPAPSPYGIPYRSLYSRNIENLMFAGRNISVTHAAMSSTRVMATCGTIGQAMGTAAAIAIRDGLTPRGVYEQRIDELKQTLMEDDCYLPFNRRAVPALTGEATLVCSAPDRENLRNGYDRPIGEDDNGCLIPLGEAVTYEFGRTAHVGRVRLILDSDLNRETLPENSWYLNMLNNRPLSFQNTPVPVTMLKGYRLEGVTPDRETVVLYETANNYQRLNFIDIDRPLTALSLIPLSTWGKEACHLFSFDVSEKSSAPTF